MKRDKRDDLILRYLYNWNWTRLIILAMGIATGVGTYYVISITG